MTATAPAADRGQTTTPGGRSAAPSPSSAAPCRQPRLRPPPTPRLLYRYFFFLLFFPSPSRTPPGLSSPSPLPPRCRSSRRRSCRDLRWQRSRHLGPSPPVTSVPSPVTSVPHSSEGRMALQPPPRHPAAFQPPPGRRCPGPSPSGGAVPRQASASSRPRRAHTPSHRSHPFPGARRRSGAGRPESARRRRRQRLPRAASPRRGR